MKQIWTKFIQDESGAITVDWVVLTAGIVLLGVGIVVPIGLTLTNNSDDVGAYIDSMTIATY